ncbi:MAG TPA: ATP-binding protein [Thermodesulfobacteriota bacterium]
MASIAPPRDVGIDRRWHPAYRYGLAVVSLVVAAVVTLLLESVRPTPFVFPFFAAVMVSAWFGGVGPGWLAVLLSTLVTSYFFMPQGVALRTGVEQLPFVLAFVVCAALANALSVARRRAERSLKQARDELEARVTARTAELRRTNEALVTEIGQRRRAEDALRLLVDVTAAASAAPGIPDLATACLTKFCDLGGWRLGQVWFVEPTTNALVCSAESFCAEGDVAELRAASLAASVRRGEGALGRVWESRAAVWLTDITTRDVPFERRDAARSAGFRSAFAFPVTVGRSVLAVFEFLDRRTREPDDSLLEVIDTLGQRLGDILERKRAEDALRRTQAELEHVTRVATLGELAASLAHELNQPLAAAVTNGNACLRWLGRDRPDIGEAAAAVRRIIQDANRASEIVAHTRALLRKSSADRTALDVGEVVREVVELVRAELRRHRIRLEPRLAGDLPTVLGVRVQLQQVALNLIMNAVEAMADVPDARRTLVLRAESHESDGGPGVLAAVEDAGKGLMEETVERLFQAFYTTKPHGLGMGLSISRSIVEAHGGRLWATPNVGHGATFRFLLPAASWPAS